MSWRVVTALLAACAGAPPGLEVPVRTGSVHDFDFLAGAWTIENRTLAPDGRWTTFASSSALRPELGGVINVDIYDLPTRGYTAMALRIFDLAARQWSITRGPPTGSWSSRAGDGRPGRAPLPVRSARRARAGRRAR